MLSGAIGLQIIARRLGVELGEQQFNTITGVDERELTFNEIKSLATNHSLVYLNMNSVKNMISVTMTVFFTFKPMKMVQRTIKYCDALSISRKKPRKSFHTIPMPF